MKSAPRLGTAFEALEDRALPTTFGVPWADPGHLTLSFVPDGTATPTGASTLFKTMAAAGSTAAWEGEILRAFQSWAARANINIGVVADGGQALGTVGAVQGDSRFGDIRIAAAPLTPDVLATASPFSWTGSTFSGDVVLNSNVLFGIGNSPKADDIYSVLVHEAGHTLGLDHSTAAGSVMNENYAYHAGLGGDDVARIQALYGPRLSDAGGNTAATAVAMSPTAYGQLLSTGDLSGPTDVDYFKFSVPPLTSMLSGVTVRLKTEGVSLLTAGITVYDSAGRGVASASATDPLNNDLLVTFRPGLLGGNYTVKVTAARTDTFGSGSHPCVGHFWLRFWSSRAVA